MKSKNMTTFIEAFKTMLPVITGMAPTAIAYALLAAGSGIKGSNVILSSLIVFAGSVQFITTELVKENTGYIQFAIIIFLLHSRHMFFGISLFDKFNKTGKAKPFMIFALTDESYAVMTNKSAKLPENVKESLYYILLPLFLYITWNTGTMVGVFVSSLITFNTGGLDFALTAMFIVIVVEQLKSHRSKLPFIIGGVAAAVSLVVIGPQSMLLGCCVVSVICLFAARKYIDGTEEESA